MGEGRKAAATSTVIASEAKQSIVQQAGLFRRYRSSQ
jgi:hypothetical protein